MVSQIDAGGILNVKAKFVENIVLQSVNRPVLGSYHIYSIIFTQYRIHQLEGIFSMYLFLTRQTINDPYRIGDACHHEREGAVFNIYMFRPIGPVVEGTVVQRFIPYAPINRTAVPGHESIKSPATAIR